MPTKSNNPFSLFDTLRRFFRLGVSSKTGKSFPKDIETPKKEPGEGYDSPARVKILSDIQRKFSQWEADLDDSQSLMDRMRRYSDLDFMFLNSGVTSLAVNLDASETVSVDENGAFISFRAPNKAVENFCYDFIKKIGVTRELLEGAAYDISGYGDHIWLHIMEEGRGIVGIRPISVFDFIERLEFSPAKLQQLYDPSTGGSQFSANRSELLQKVSQAILDSQGGVVDYSAYFKQYLLGFVVGREAQIAVPPWSITHFRRYASRSEFYPYGRSAYINSLSLFRQLKSAQSMLAMLRVAKLPKEVFKVKGSETNDMSESEIWTQVNKAREQYYNLGILDNGKEENGVGGSIWTHDKLYEYEIQSVDVNLDDIADVKMLEDDLITSTGVPKEYLIQDQSWGNSGIALAHQSKMYARKIYVNQTALLEGITALIRMQLEILGLYEGANTEFEVSLPYPVMDEGSERLQFQSDSLDFARAILDNISATTGIDVTQFPKEIIVDILGTFSFLKTKEVDNWVTAILKKAEEEGIEQDEKGSADLGGGVNFSSPSGGGGGGSPGSDLDLPDIEAGSEAAPAPADAGEDLFGSEDIDLSVEGYQGKGRPIYEVRLNKVRKRLTEEVARLVYFKTKAQRGMLEGFGNGDHWMNSQCGVTEDIRYLYELIRRDDRKLIKEQFSVPKKDATIEE